MEEDWWGPGYGEREEERENEETFGVTYKGTDSIRGLSILVAKLPPKTLTS
jgi:hypothetical protein